jgi:hypothetical protein
MDALITLIILFLIVWFLWSGIRSKEIACDAGLLHCEKHNVQFLDQTVERLKLRFTRDSRNNPCWYRSFRFEFATSGEHRYQGVIEMYGHRLKSIKMDPYPESHADEQPGLIH